ncbi:HD domain-containing phosphohydrolase [Effusibacillus consociatus]|uniref:HD domain-containing phosphohydrolase n=1 Tax=Effusibacillus consociatus TaxID=1117041 RepID=A0ABV9Q5T2_9BACL
MRDLNWYTGSLFLIGIYALFHAIYIHQTDHWPVLLLITGLIVVLDLFPIKLPSGDEYAAGTIGSLLLLYHIGLTASIISITISIFFAFLKRYRSVRKINWFRYFVTIGMYFICASISSVVIQLTDDLSIFVSVWLTASTFDVLNTLLLAGIGKSLMGTPIFHHFTDKLRELIVPVFVCVIVIPRFLFVPDLTQLVVELLYTAFFLLIIIFFSTQFINQITIRQHTSNEFIRLLENRITPSLAGHGARVGLICDMLIEDLGYPKNKKHNLIQMAIIHDIGKSLLPSHVFRKRGALTLSEEKEYQSHCEKGAEIVRSTFPNDKFADWILYHHEQWDGKGFPSGLKENDIPFESRILSLCNQLDHIMTRHRDDTTVYQLLQEMSGTVLDPLLTAKIDISTISYIRENLSYESHSQMDESIETNEDSRNEEKSHIGRSFFLQYTSDNQLANHDNALPIDEVSRLAKLSRETKQTFHETIAYNEKTMEIHFYPSNTEVLIFVHDLTPMLEYRMKTTRKVLESYQDVIRTLSDEKIVLCTSEAELKGHLGEYIDSMQVNSAADVPISRNFVSKYIPDFLKPQFHMKIMLAVSEGATNLIKHATDGEISLYSKESTFQVLISDKGSGILLHEIPKTLLVSGYSSKRSLGKGFSVMSKSAHKVTVYTSTRGTSILMEFSHESSEIKKDLIS